MSEVLETLLIYLKLQVHDRFFAIAFFIVVMIICAFIEFHFQKNRKG